LAADKNCVSSFAERNSSFLAARQEIPIGEGREAAAAINEYLAK